MVVEDKGIIGQMMRVAAIEMGGRDLGLNVFVDFVENMMRYFEKEKKRKENRTEERKKSGWVDREREREKKRSMRPISRPPT